MAKKRGETPPIEENLPKLADFQEEEGDSPIVADVDSSRPLRTSPEWTAWVLKQFTEDELYDGRPTRDGLARITELLIGPILRSSARVVESPSAQNGWQATVEHTVVVYHPEVGELARTEVADVNTFNAEARFVIRGSATASTLAEARALRKLLGLKLIHSAEEMDGATDDVNLGFINESQLRFLNMLGSRLNINVMKFVNLGEKHYVDYRAIPYVTAQKMFPVLNNYQIGTTPIPPDIKGFDARWCPELNQKSKPEN